MKNKIGFNIGFALIAFTLGLALLREFDFQNYVFRKQAFRISLPDSIYYQLISNI